MALDYSWKKTVFNHKAELEKCDEDYENIAEIDTALDLFSLFFSADILSDVVEQTNVPQNAAFLEKIRKNCLAQERETKFSIDEMMKPYKGKKAGNRRQYMKDKPTKWGFKNYVRAGVSGMIYDFILYGAEDTFRGYTFTEKEASVGFGAQIVLALCKSIKKKPATVYCDNFFHRRN
ncbi:hypothetical protein MSG28_011717 [Choristoneura fumiferana]|uniref:Uncharacterized protein n=1 Tax=Choristoneura fumiferana TaxID=7141 RepID=A0ACC0KLD2_CHOFU|nr:hypothetical protein MSG28_011717 [Choristoneura fumiferana]